MLHTSSELTYILTCIRPALAQLLSISDRIENPHSVPLRHWARPLAGCMIVLALYVLGVGEDSLCFRQCGVTNTTSNRRVAVLLHPARTGEWPVFGHANTCWRYCSLLRRGYHGAFRSPHRKANQLSITPGSTSLPMSRQYIPSSSTCRCSTLRKIQSPSTLLRDLKWHNPMAERIYYRCALAIG